MYLISVDGACKVFSAEVAVDKIQVVRRKSIDCDRMRVGQLLIIDRVYIYNLLVA